MEAHWKARECVGAMVPVGYKCVHNKVGLYVRNDMSDRFGSDCKIFHDLGLDSARTSFQWTRLIDRNGQLNKEGAAYYHDMIVQAKVAGIELFVNLYHFDMPAYILDRGGWEKRETVEAFADYSRTDCGFRLLKILNER